MPEEFSYIYPQNTQEATLRLQSEIKETILQNGPIPFTTFMHLALYHPELGYYTRGPANIGKTGDYITSISIGPCFGTILAHRIAKEWSQQGKPKTFHLVEQGANTGQLAKDILNTLKTNFPTLYTATQYHIIEHLPSITQTQKKTLAQHLQHLHHHTKPTHIGQNGILLSNELLDALPVHLLTYHTHQWHERKITLDKNQQLTHTLTPLSQPLLLATQPIRQALPHPPENYQTEYRPNINQYTTKAKKILTKALTITIDYGHTASTYYTPSRNTGTLRCYHQHQADENPLHLPGLKDITAHLDFTQLGNALRTAGFHLTHFSSQSHYLTTHAAEWLTNMEKNNTLDHKLIRQFQTLTHPTTMGHQFHILEAHTHQPENTQTLEKLEINTQTNQTPKIPKKP